MEINLPVFKDEDMKDAVTYQSRHWDLMVYQQAGFQDCTLLPLHCLLPTGLSHAVGKKFGL